VTAGLAWLAASAGALSLLTPCVFPMVPITVAYFTEHSAPTRRLAVRHALLFGVGIIATFTAVGLALAGLVGATAVMQIAASPWVNLALAAIFIAFAVNLFGLYEVALPSAWVVRADAAARRRSDRGRAIDVAAAALMGLTFTLTSFTCTAPFVGTVLVAAAQGSWRMPILGMLVYSTIFALPFCVLAAVPSWLTRLPRAGRWLESVKVVMGLLEVAAAMKFLANADLVWHWGIFTRSVVLVAWILVALAAAVYLVRPAPRATAGPTVRRLPGRLVAAACPLAAAVWLTSGLQGHGLGELESFLPPAASEVTAPAALAWRVNDYDGALVQARRQGKRLFIDFTGYTCTNCRWMEANMFTRPDVRAALGRYVLARLFTDGEGAIYDRQQALQQARFNTVALPLYAVVDADGRTVASLPGLTRDPAVFVAFLRRGLGSAPR